MVGWEPPPLPGRTAGMEGPVFVGRAAECEAAERAWGAVRGGTRRLIFVGGEPGAGKTRLVQEVCAAVHRQGAVVLVGACTPGPVPPYQPFVECLEQLLAGTPAGALTDRLADSASELLRLTPLVSRHRPDLSPPSGDECEYRRELFDAYVELLHGVSVDHPVVCVIEDLHWAGTPSLQLLAHIAQKSTQSRLLLLGTHRTTAPDRSDELTYAIADLYRLDGVRRLDLTGLTTDDVAEYLVAESRLPVRRAREYAAILRDQTGGNPFFLREVLRDLSDSDGEGGHRTPMGARAVSARTPLSIRDTLQRRLSRLQPFERDVLETAAVLGDGGDVRTLVAVCADAPGDALAAIDTAARFGLIDADQLARGRLSFTHMLTRQAVHDLVRPSRRALLHSRIGEVLRSTGADSPDLARKLGHHFARASALGFGGLAAEYLARSAREAERSLAFEDAAAWYVQSADLSDDGQPQREKLRFAAARCHVRAGDFASARRVYLELSESVDQMVRLRAAIAFEDAGWRPGLPGAQACALLSRAIDDVPADPTDAGYVWAVASLGRATAFTGDADRARALGRRALGYARELGDDELLSHVLETMMWHAVAPESVGQQRELANELSGLASASRNWDALGTAAVFRSAIAYMQSDLPGWAEAVTDLDRAVRGTGQPFMAYMRGCMDYAHAFLNADFTNAERVAEDLLELGRSFGPDDTEGPYGLQMFMIRRETAALESVRPLVEAGARDSDAWEPGLLALYTELGIADEARPLLSQLLARLDTVHERQPPWAQWTAVLVFLVEAAIALRDRAAARRLRPLVALYTGLQLVAGQFVAVFGPADAFLAAIDALLGDDESAERLYDRALSQAAAVGSVVHRATTAADLGDLLDRRGDALSRARAAEMWDLAERLGSGTTRVSRRIARRRSATVAPAGLTARELDVLRLLANGTSNRDIAVKLRITENTAANHVRSILIKTGASNRTHVAMMAVSRGWVHDDPGHRPDRG